MKFLAPEYATLMLGVFVILAIYIFIRRRIVVQTGFYNLWLEAAQELGYLKKLRWRKILSILLAMIIFSLIVFSMMQPTPETKEIDESEQIESKTFVIIDTFSETFPFSTQCYNLRNILKDFADRKLEGKVVFTDVEGMHIRSFKESADIDWSKHLTFTKPKIGEIIDNTKGIINENDEILVVTLNENLCRESFSEESRQILDRIKFFKIPGKTVNKELTDTAIMRIEQVPEFPFEAKEIRIFVKNFSENSVQAQIVTHPGNNILRTLEIQPGESSVTIPAFDIVSSIAVNKNNEIIFLTVDDPTDFRPLYYQSIRGIYSSQHGFPMKIELRNLSDAYDVRPANNFAMCCLNPVNSPKVAVVGEDADNEYVKLLFSVLQDAGILTLVKMSDYPEIVVQLGKTELFIPDYVDIIKFEPGIAEYDAPNAMFWKKNGLFDAEILQKFYFSLKKVSYQLTGTGENLLESPGGTLGKITQNEGRYIIHFSFSINPENSDFLLRSELAPALFSRIFQALTKKKLQIALKPVYFVNENVDFWANKHLETVEIQNYSGKTIQEFAELPKSTVNSLPAPNFPGFYHLLTDESENYFAVNTIRTDFDLAEFEKLPDFAAPRSKIDEKEQRTSDEFVFLILFVQIAFLLVFIETLLYRFRITE